MNKIGANFTNREIGSLLKHKAIVEKLDSGSPFISISPDKDILGATVGQAHLMILGISNPTPELSAEIFLRCNAVAIKLCALRYHRNNYEKLQKKRLSELSTELAVSELIKRGLKICELEMLHELESFFFQFKSALDMLVKVLCPITGLNAGTLSTYGNYGNGIIKILNKFKKNKNHGLAVGRIDWLIEEIEKTKSPWMESVIKIRDTFSHYKFEIALGFEWDREIGRIKVPHATTENGASPLNFEMDKLTHSLINYCANFIAITVSFTFPVTTTIQVMSEDEKRYIGARWQMDLSKAIWKLGSNVIREYTEQDIENAKKWAEQNIFDY